MAKEEILIEKVIWLIEDSYPDTGEWGHDALLENIKESLETRADELKRMFGDSEIPTSPWHKASEEPPKENFTVLGIGISEYPYICRYMYGHWFSEDNLTERIIVTHWMEIPELPKE